MRKSNKVVRQYTQIYPNGMNGQGYPNYMDEQGFRQELNGQGGQGGKGDPKKGGKKKKWIIWTTVAVVATVLTVGIAAGYYMMKKSNTETTKQANTEKVQKSKKVEENKKKFKLSPTAEGAQSAYERDLAYAKKTGSPLAWSEDEYKKKIDNAKTPDEKEQLEEEEQNVGTVLPVPANAQKELQQVLTALQNKECGKLQEHIRFDGGCEYYEGIQIDKKYEGYEGGMTKGEMTYQFPYRLSRRDVLNIGVSPDGIIESIGYLASQELVGDGTN